MKKLLMSLVVLLLVLTSCSNNDTDETKPTDEDQQETVDQDQEDVSNEEVDTPNEEVDTDDHADEPVKDVAALDANKYVCKSWNHGREQDLENVHILIGNAAEDTLEKYIGKVILNDRNTDLLVEMTAKAEAKPEVAGVSHEVVSNDRIFKEFTEADMTSVSVADLVENKYLPEDFTTVNSFKALVNSFVEARYSCYPEN